jgi:hypothetical protein
MEFSYNTIKELARVSGCKISDLIALASQNDPFYQGTPSSLALAEWFAEFYHNNFRVGTQVHIRRCHYVIVSLGLVLPSGKPYENTEEAWNTLIMASKAARYLGLVDIYSFVDRKNDPPYDRSHNYFYDPYASVGDDLSSSNLQLPDFPNYPTYNLYGYEAHQPYHLEMWCEKTTMNDILMPLCDRYGMVLQTGAGELSISATASLANRIKEAAKPIRIFYISDFDPAGQSMPVAVSRKLEYFVRNENLDVDVRLFPVVLTANQVQEYRLPRTPIKESERRRGSFEQHHGTGAVELDALEALHPGELQRILRRYIERYYDTDLENRTRQERRVLERDLAAIRESVVNRYTGQIGEVRAELEGIRADLAERMENYSDHLQELWRAISSDLENEAPDMSEYPIPEGKEANEIAGGLYNSQRSYLEQIDIYKQFQGKAS